MNQPTPMLRELTVRYRRPVIVGRQVTIVADVIDVSPATKTITVKGPKGNIVELEVQNQDHFKVVKKGDQIEANYVEAVAVSLEPAKKGAKK